MSHHIPLPSAVPLHSALPRISIQNSSTSSSSSVSVASVRSRYVCPRYSHSISFLHDSFDRLYTSLCMNVCYPHTFRSFIHKQRLMAIELSTNKEILSNHVANVNMLAMEQVENRYLLSCGGDSIISLYDCMDEINTQGYKTKPLTPNKWGPGHEFAVNCVEWYPHDTGMFISAGADGTIKIWDSNELTVAQEFKLHKMIHTALMSPVATSHSLVAVGCTVPQVRLCDLISGATSHTLQGHKDEILSVAWSPINEFMIVSASKDRTIRVWDIRRAGTLMIFDHYNQFDPHINKKYINASDAHSHRDVHSHDGEITHIQFTRDGLYLLSAGTDQKIILWDAIRGKNLLVNYEEVQTRTRMNRFCISSDSRFLFFPNGLFIYMYHIQTGKLMKKLKGHMERVICTTTNVITDDIYSGSADRSILVWSPQQLDDPQVEDDSKRDDDDDNDWIEQTEAIAATTAAIHARVVAANANANANANVGSVSADVDAWSDEENEITHRRNAVPIGIGPGINSDIVTPSTRSSVSTSTLPFNIRRTSALSPRQ